MSTSLKNNYFRGSFSLFYSAYTKKQLKFSTIREAVFFGRSNVGKSSLINSLCNQKNLAKTSKTPGLTAAIHFFINDKKNFTIVDVPGYGYAKTNKDDKYGWGKLLSEYLQQKKKDRIILILIDSRRGIMPADIDLCSLCENLESEFVIIITKIDKLASKDRDDVYNSVLSTVGNFKYFSKQIILSSSSKNIGLNDIKNFINKTL